MYMYMHLRGQNWFIHLILIRATAAVNEDNDGEEVEGGEDDDLENDGDDISDDEDEGDV